MDRPVKVIWKYKNSNRRVQYNVYIFVGNVSSSVAKVLKKIENLQLYDALLALSKSDIEVLTNKYGNDWFYDFYNKYHINYVIGLIIKNPKQRKELISKYGRDWVAQYIDSYRIDYNKPLISYFQAVKSHNERSEKRRRKKAKTDEDIERVYRINNRKDINNLFIRGGQADDEEEIEIADEDIGDLAEKYVEAENNEEKIEEDVELDTENIEELFTGVDIDKDANKTENMISKALDIEKNENILDYVPFEESKNNSPYDEKLKDIYNKKFIYSVYVYKDDNIKKLKEKIAVTMKNSNIFGNDCWVIPSRQYLWLEYVYEKKLEKIMFGHKWLRRTEVIDVDVEPLDVFRYYEELGDSLSLLNMNMIRYGRRINMENDEYKILRDFREYMQNNEVYMVDIYNELGKGYTPSQDIINNLTSIYTKLYFPKIDRDSFRNILDYVKDKESDETDIIKKTYQTLRNDLTIENEVMMFMEEKKKIKKDNYFNPGYVTQTVINVDIGINNTRGKLDMYKLFDSFKTSELYPYIQYKIDDETAYFKFSSEETERQITNGNSQKIKKWLEVGSKKIVFRINMKKGDEEYKHLTVNFDENGRIDYKTQWKEAEQATLEEVTSTYTYIRALIDKLNKDMGENTLGIPPDHNFNYAFISTIQKFDLPKDFVINDNDLSEFARYFYPYIAVVVEPRKRMAKTPVQDKSKGKSGTYLRYRRISDYDNPEKITQLIIYYIKNYDVTDAKLSLEIARQFNITDEKATEYVNKVREKYPRLKRARKVLRKLDPNSAPKRSHPGIYLNIQGKPSTGYKIKTSGARTPEQLNDIREFIETLIYLYTQAYLFKKKDYDFIKDRLKKLTNIARRRNLVETAVDHGDNVPSKRKLLKLDKMRIGFKPEKGQNQWRRACQNSGTDKMRQPIWRGEDNMDDILKLGYKYNSKSGVYERKVKIVEKGEKKEVVLRSVPLFAPDKNGKPTEKRVHYTCNPENNGDHIYIGFLTKSGNPFGLCMPCCFKKDPVASKDPKKREFFLRCLDQGSTDIKTKNEGKNEVVGDRLYILQDTNKVQEGRFSYLPNLIDTYLNKKLGKVREVKQHYLVKTTTGYFLKYGISHQRNSFISAIASIFNISITKLLDKIETTLRSPRGEAIFTAIQDGRIRREYDTIDNYLKFIRNSEMVPYNMIISIVSIPGVLVPNGTNLIVFERTITHVRRMFEKDHIIEDFNISCSYVDEIDGLKKEKKSTIFLLKDDGYYYPIVLLTKKNSASKVIDIEKEFKYSNEPNNIVNYVSEYFYKNCGYSIIGRTGIENNIHTAKNTYKILVSSGIKEFIPIAQYIDTHYKCRYLILKNNIAIPVKPSGALYTLPIIDKLTKYKNSFNYSYEKINLIISKLSSSFNYDVTGVYYKPSEDKNSIKLTGIQLSNKSVIPIKDNVNKKIIEKLGLDMIMKPFDDIINKLIETGSAIPDDRVKGVNNAIYFRESYQRFRLEIYKYFDNPNNIRIREKVIDIVNDRNIKKPTKRASIKRILYSIVDKGMHKLFNNITENAEKTTAQKGGFVAIIPKKPDTKDYTLESIRKSCSDKYNPFHCKTKDNICKLALTKEMIVIFINKASEEIVQMNIPGNELLGLNGLYVTDVVDYSMFTERKGQKIIKSTRADINAVMETLFSGEVHNEPDKDSINYQEMKKQNPPNRVGDMIIQNVFLESSPTIRAYSNGYNWIADLNSESFERNIGYASEKQTILTNYFRSAVIDYVNNPENRDYLNNIMATYTTNGNSKDMIRDYILSLMNIDGRRTNGLVELIILSKVFDRTPIFIYDENYEPIYIFHNGVVFDHKLEIYKPKQYDMYTTTGKYSTVFIRLIYETDSAGVIPSGVDAIYYEK